MTIKLQASDQVILDEAEATARRALVGNLRILEKQEAEHVFDLWSRGSRLYLSLNGQELSYDDRRPRYFKFFNSMLRIAVAEHAVDKVFVHAGVVGWKGKAIVIPGNSFSGKTTLVEELVKVGAEYYSDEYAVIDEIGLIHPFPRDLSVRYKAEGTTLEKDVSAASLGATTGVSPIPLGLVVITKFEENATPQFRRLTAGQGIMEVIPHTISRNINPQFALKVLNTAVSDAIILKSPRGNADGFAIYLLNFFDNLPNLTKII